MSDDDLDSVLRNVARSPHRRVEPRFSGDARYAVGSLLGEGSFGVVYEAFDRARNEQVAIKVLKTESSEALLRFKREFRELSRLFDPSFVRLYDLHAKDRWYFTMERVDGVSFDAWARDSERLCDALEQLFQALGRLHGHGFVHRDVKPANVLVQRDGRVKILDFGLVHAAIDATATAISGTPMYIAPEVAAGGAATAASDWYAVGVMLYEILTGESPFDGSAQEILNKKQVLNAPPIRSRAPHAPPQLAELGDALLRRTPSERPRPFTGRSQGVVTARSAKSELPPFIGRNTELDTIERAVGRTPSVVRVFGPSGVGKTALLERAASRLRSQGVRVLRSRCHPSAHVPFVALDGAVDDLARVLAQTPAAVSRATAPRDADALVRAFPVLRSIPGFDGTTAGDGARSRVAASLASIFSRSGDHRPWVIVVDDAQWGDADSTAVINEMLRDESLPLCIVLAYRQGGSGPLVEGVERSAVEVRVDPLPAEDAAALALHAGASQDIDSIVADSGGHPLFVLELVRDRESGGRHRSLQEIIGARFASLSADAARCARLLAVAERPLQTALIRHLEVAPAALDELFSARLATLHDTDTIGMRHDRIREFLVDTLSVETRRGLHREIANAVATVFPDASDIVGLHLHQAGDFAVASHELLRAARTATGRRAFAQARNLYGKVFAARQQAGLHDGDDELRVESAEASARAGMSVEAADGFLAAANRAPAGAALLLRIRGAEQLVTSGHFERGQRILDAQLSQLGLSVGSSLPGQALQLVRARIGRHLDRLGAREASEARITALWSACFGAMSVRPARAASIVAALVREAARPGASTYARVAAAFIDAFGRVGAAGPDALPHALARVARETEDLSDPRVALLAAMSEGALLYYGLDFRGSAPKLDRVMAIKDEHALGHLAEETFTRAMRSAAAWVLGDVRYLLMHVRPTAAELREREHVLGWLLFAGYSTWLTLMERGLGPHVLGEFDEVRRHTNSHELNLQTWWVDIARVHFALARGDGRTAWDLSRPQARPYMERIFSTRMHRLEAQTFLGRAAIHMAMHAPQRARVEVAKASELAQSLAAIPSAWTRAHSLCLRAGLASVSGDRELTLRLLRAALHAIDDAGMIMHRTLVELALGKTLGGDEGTTLVAGAEARLREWGFDRDVALACTLPGQW